MARALRLVFAGTPAFAAIALEALITNTAHEIVAVYTQPDKPAGRGLKLTKSPVKLLAEKNHLLCRQPSSLKSPEAASELADLQADVMVVAAYGMLLPASILAIPRWGCINIHPSMLPRWRGAAPLQHTILAGDRVSGVTIMQMDEGLDTGPILLQEEYSLQPNETTASLHDQLAIRGANALIKVLAGLETRKLEPLPQENSLATYAGKLSKADARLDWTRSAVELERQVRGLNPWPVAETIWQDQVLRIWQADVIAAPHVFSTPGTIMHVSPSGITVATHKDWLCLREVQLPGGRRLSVSDFLAAHLQAIKIGQCLA